MNTKKSFLLMASMIVFSSCLINSRTIEGNGKVVTRNIAITDYKELNVGGSVDVEYEESAAAPFLSITLDENLFEYIRAEVEGSELKIGPKRENGVGVNIRPTVFKAKTNSRMLEEVSLSGSGNINARNISASSSFEANLSGSGNMNIERINVKDLECSLSGSGNIRISGSTGKAEYNLSGSGNIKAADCQAERAEASLAGSGDIQLHASSTLEASIVGSGNVLYKGNPQLKSSKIGSGSIKSF
ncbi:MAG: DUF2807 domain-containing protein [Tannerellaceae bacterium]|jgi:hypothetical protein|nr:DUF2807 domain-containing protein [Tannerellaceae bacterium]